METEAGGLRYTAGAPLEGLESGTLSDQFFASAAQFSGVAASRREAGEWRDFDRADLVDRIRALAAGLRGLGCEAGDRVAIISHTRLEWALADWAAVLGGRVVVTVYPVLPPDQVLHIFRDSGARFAFAEDEAQLSKILEVQAELPGL